ncbi:helix-turn-helix domain-containing protein [Flagellimonas nanhaiensis]|uniref:XRE family transcriptional regulator n=1 Tax=Flagellimonas nanhaiensis TaxID=2292706 RepID=A0A371JLH1_9FLAO|nr:helix-turn-helix transcriptional regulator [Allomuricauda nanhaiensis]RDY57840.1 XRE family transcriptional regulator [Allomuricauda nanhaiensis]
MNSELKNNEKFRILFGENLKKIRKSKNLSFRKLAQRCDVDHANLNKIEKGTINISMNTIYEISKGLDIQPKELFDFEIKYDID